MAFSEEIKIEALRNPRDPLRRDFDYVLVAAGREEAEPVARRLAEPTVPGQEALLPMSISAIVPVWNGRDLLARLLATLAAQTVPPAKCWWWITARPTARRKWRARRGARVIAMGRNAGFAAAVNRGISGGRGMVAVLNSDVELAPDYSRSSPRSTRALVRHRQDSQSAAGLLDGDVRPDLPRRRHLARAAAAARWAAVRPTARDLVAALDRRRCSAPKFSPGRACWRKLRIVSGGCGFRVALRRAKASGLLRSRCGGGTAAAPRWGAGIRKRCGASRAISCFSRPAITLRPD